MSVVNSDNTLLFPFIYIFITTSFSYDKELV